MIRKEKIKELINDKVVNVLDQELSKHGFKYLKSKERFVRKTNGFIHSISVDSAYQPLEQADDEAGIFLNFHVHAILEIDGFEEWSLKTFGSMNHYSYMFDGFASQVKISVSDFTKDSFYEPTANQKFKHAIGIALGGSNSTFNNAKVTFESMQEGIPALAKKMNDCSDIDVLYNYENNKTRLIYPLAFLGKLDIARQEAQRSFKALIGFIDAKKGIMDNEMRSYLNSLDELVDVSKKVLQLVLVNPFDRIVKLAAKQNNTITISPHTMFVESLRLDVSKFKDHSVSVCVNPQGELMLFIENKKVLKFGTGGELLLDADIEAAQGLSKIYWPVWGVVGGTNHFFVNNYIITSENTVKELKLPSVEVKKGQLQRSDIDDLIYCEKTQQFIVLYGTNLIWYSKEGKQMKLVKVGHERGKIIKEKEWVITQKDNQVFIWNFEGTLICSYPYANGNSKYAFSSNYQHLICFFYSTKSQFFDLSNGKKASLWAHPTYIKGYIETLYPNIRPNLGMSIVQFSPDNSYIVGGAEEGKYVAWKMPKLERVELIPTAEVIDLLPPEVYNRHYEDRSEKITNKVEVITLDNKQFLKNRKNELTKIIFFENGDYFLTEIRSCGLILIWDRNFNNIAHTRLDGRIEMHANKYLTVINEKELVCYRVNGN